MHLANAGSTMSPNNNHLLNSYQHDHCSSEHEPLSIDVNFDQVDEGGVGAGGIDIGIMSKPSRNSPTNEYAEESSSFTELLQKRATGHKSLLLLASLLSAFGIGWFASSLFSASGRTSGHSPAKEDGDVVEQPDVVIPESTNSIPDLIWSDEFDGDTVDLTKWTFVNGNGCDVGLCGWGEFLSTSLCYVMCIEHYPHPDLMYLMFVNDLQLNDDMI